MPLEADFCRRSKFARGGEFGAIVGGGIVPLEALCYGIFVVDRCHRRLKTLYQRRKTRSSLEYVLQ